MVAVLQSSITAAIGLSWIRVVRMIDHKMNEKPLSKKPEVHSAYCKTSRMELLCENS